MPKSIVIEPKEVFAKSTIHLSDIPISTYNRTLEQELVNYSTEDFLHIWQDMCAIREFETILNEIKTKGAYKGVAYNHAGPAHLSIGQEAAAVGMAFSLSDGCPELGQCIAKWMSGHIGHCIGPVLLKTTMCFSAGESRRGYVLDRLCGRV
jgi:hypothetical protein